MSLKRLHLFFVFLNSVVFRDLFFFSSFIRHGRRGKRFRHFGTAPLTLPLPLVPMGVASPRLATN